ncbi:kinase-like protein [Schizopora paradoxa]|uniref:Kinase-like protein n=1 Tax=Schizopora paradoxa TaxID=27342 RepID=A0A0H2S2F6_9AGAM|nr:kinase-like protein [Schizopora paradoxa]
MVRLEELLLSLSHLDLQNEIVEKKAEVEGFGGSCDVFSAWSRKHDKSVAVKQLRAHLRMDVALAKRLAREMRIWAKLKHPNILPFLGFFVEGKNRVLSLISEWMENGTLYHFMKTFPRGGTIARIILRGIASGLDYLHSQNVIHADLKSANILISSFGTPLLADFGLSLAVSSTQSMSNPSSSSSGADTKGTVRWMAIELLPMNDEIPHQVPDKKSDVWAFGMIIYELLSWKKPYYTQTQDTLVVIAINNGARPTKPEEGSSSAVFDHLWSLAQICWHTDPSARPHTISLLSYLSMPCKYLDI